MSAPENIKLILPALEKLGITQQDCDNCSLAYHHEAKGLVEAGLDIFDRPQKMTAETLEAWLTMQAAAETKGIKLQLVSAYRSVSYQLRLIAKKLESGRSIQDILKVNAIPGFSEHHTGRALDLTTLGFEVLSESFELSPAFIWLMDHGAEYKFQLSYPRDNSSAISYEPWHWAFQG